MLNVVSSINSARKDPELLVKKYLRHSFKSLVFAEEFKERIASPNPVDVIVSKMRLPITTDDLDKDYKNLLLGKTKGGLKIIDKFTMNERLGTKGKRGISFLEFLENPQLTESQERFLQKQRTQHPDRDDTYHYHILYKYAHSSIAVFPPSQMSHILIKHKIETVLDPTMGWGGRLLGAVASMAKGYIGIDSNQNLIEPYHHLKTFVERKNGFNTNIQLYFRDCLSIDYNTLDYDCVFTSPPYYNIETYTDQPQTYKNKLEWNEKFYRPLVTKTYGGLKENGIYCLNINQEIYEFIKTILGDANEKIPLSKPSMRSNSYEEFIYIWKKPERITVEISICC